MLWASEALGRDGKPAVLLLAARRTREAVVAEAAYVAADLPEGPLVGRYYRNAHREPERLALVWPGGWPGVSPTNRLHPRRDTPEAAVTEGDDGRRLMRLNITEGDKE